MFVENRTLYRTDEEDIKTCMKIKKLFCNMHDKYMTFCADEGKNFPCPRNAKDLHATFDRFMSSLRDLEMFVRWWYDEEEGKDKDDEDENEDEDE